MRNKKIYFIDTYYTEKPSLIGAVQDFKIPLSKIVEVTLKAIISFADDYYFSIPKIINNKIPSFKAEGKIPENKNKFIKDICAKLFNNNQNFGFFELYLYNGDLKTKSIFNWSLGDFIWLELNQDQFEHIRSTLMRNNLPKDLYYKKGDEIKTLPINNSIFSKIRRLLNWKKKYTPRQWLVEKQTYSKIN